ncbi:long-chain-acyl-CoA synthetase [Lichenihabitans sp. PAMC28606]|uniref:long-chain-acyl-CoA synthetase n=1 Tax=Lichenihabitans sp. PAMC28606 TaxID=2880932 RepID=UPI001D0BDC4D|nr:long-chain-acyl-CoA synthetase [Lichenihabitans sp. PAMC28606]UDL94778.1 long-chain-acyl-CoA synthetase [Lichenihabitans sp. PAMC28606]
MGVFERIGSELTFLRGLVRTLRRTMPVARNKTHTLGDLIEELAVRFGDRLALTDDTESLTYVGLNARANLYARWALHHGIRKGDVVALLMPNRPEYLAIWIGIAKVGGVTALINTSLTGASLAHSIRIVGAKAIIVAAPLLERYESAAPGLVDPPAVLVHGASPTAHPRIDHLLDSYASHNLSQAERVPLTINDRCIFVYTSGTTGMPKAANINHYRVQLIMHGFAAVTNATASDRIYDSLPMYHTNGGVIAPGIALMSGGTCVIRDRFSAREFWPDIVRHECTMFVYIGELCRYILDTPPSPVDRTHRVRLCVGNGLRPDVWRPFRDRFGLKQIIEFYAATEGNCSMFNLDSKPEAVGRVPRWIASRFPIRIVDFDIATEQVVRGPDGLCRETPNGMPGELIGEILDDPAKPGNRFEGYSDQSASDAKILRDVFRKGDVWFRTGDLMRKDNQGYFYFVDRIGDTFRWKGENVATSEVMEAIAVFPSVKDVSVYGVKVPGRDGRAGMASLVVDPSASFDFAAFQAHLKQRLPDYATPVFLRFADHLDVTGTFKQRKIDLVREGFDPCVVGDPLYYLEPDSKSFQPLDIEQAGRISAGTMRL